MVESLFTGRWSLEAPAWVADHVVMDSVVVPGTAFVELALHVATQLGYDSVEELVMESPLVLSDRHAVQLQVTVEGVDDAGRQSVKIYSRPEAAGSDVDVKGTWTRHVSCVLAGDKADSTDQDALHRRIAMLAGDAWPPRDAVALDVEEFYAYMTAIGFDYGPAFLGVRALWMSGRDMFVEVSLPQDEHSDAAGYGIHPALFDAAIQAIGRILDDGFMEVADDSDALRLPFAFNGVRLGATGASTLRVHLSPVGSDAASLVAVDENGELAISMQSLTLRTVSRERLVNARDGNRKSLFGLEWTALAIGLSAEVAPVEEWVVLGAGPLSRGKSAWSASPEVYDDIDSLRNALDTGRGVPSVVLADCGIEGIGLGEEGHVPETADPGATHELACRVLALVQGWLADERFSTSRLLLVTSGAISVNPEEDVPALAQTPVWGLVRSVQSESPGRLVLVDLDGEDTSAAVLPAVLASEEPQIAVRKGSMFAPRVVPLPSSSASRDEPAQGLGKMDPDGTILITGGTGELGALMAKHLVVVHGARHLLLASRQGRAAARSEKLEAELSERGAHVKIVACDVANRTQLEKLLESVERDHPLTVVVHAAGVLDDGVVESLSGERLDQVLAPKVDAALHLHDLTAHLELAAFVMFSSAAAILGSAGQASYAAANSFLDGLAAYRRAQGLSGTSLAWGLWGGVRGMAGELGELDLTRIARSGLVALAEEEALGLFDSAMLADTSLALPMRLDMSVLRAQAEDGSLPAILRGLARVPSRRSGDVADSLVRRLAAVSESERDGVMLNVVRVEVAAVLGHASAAAIPAQQPFRELGFDSLMAVELRNRLNGVTGLRLPTTLVFDYPSSAVLADYLVKEMAGIQPTQAEWTVPLTAPTANEDPIAIVGMSCRYPGGVSSPVELWDLVMAGRDAISPFPEDRCWDLEGLYDPDPDTPGTCYAREGGFLSDVAGFDAAFFGISPREALAMDPQQRLLLEACWEAFEDAAIDPGSLRGSQTGVFAGVSAMDFGAGLWTAPRGLESLAGYWLTGSAGSVISGRVSYVFGLEGPAVSVDTACSSSLVALHLACQALRNGECSMALAGGVTVMDTPGLYVQFSGQRGLARDGRCKSFADCADGVGWGEGVGVLVLERLSEAQRHGHRVLALVSGSAINQDGASNGLTAPNGPSQQRVIRQALARARLSPAQISAVDGHGTGTTLGDPIEAHALLATYGQERETVDPLWLGSIKSNIGHTVAAAGVASVIKMVMAMHHGVLPKTLHVDEPSRQVDWSSGAVALLSTEQPWERNGEPRRAGISSFGVSGTNAHVILEEGPSVSRTATSSGQKDALEMTLEEPGVRRLTPWVLSARDEAGLRDQAARLREFLLGRTAISTSDIGRSLTSRPSFDCRAFLLGESRESLLISLGELADSDLQDAKLTGAVVQDTVGGEGQLAFLFTGQGAQRVGMGSELYRTFDVFRDAFDETCGFLDDLIGHSLKAVVFGEHTSEDELAGSDRRSLLDETLFTQTGLFAFELALFRLLGSLGVRPDYLVGHSVGELVAAHVAGVLSLQDACVLVAARGRLMGELPAGGAMAAVQASEREAVESLARYEGRAALAAVNGPRAVVFSGDEDAVSELESLWSERGRKVKRLSVSHAFHSPRMDRMLDEFAEVVEGLSFSEPTIPIVSNLTGEAVTGDEVCDSRYWVRHVRQTVRFADGVSWLLAHGASTFLELGPDGVLSAMVGECLAERVDQDRKGGYARPASEDASLAGLVSGGVEQPAAVVVPLLRAKRQEGQTLLAAVARLWVSGVEVDWDVLFDGPEAELVALPTYAFQRQRFWLEDGGWRGGDARAFGQAPSDHPLLSAAVALADERSWLFTGRLSLSEHSWLADHVVLGNVLLAPTAFLELALHVGAEVGCEVVRELVLQRPLVLDERGVQMQVIVGEGDEPDVRTVSIYSRVESTSGDDLDEGAEWVCHAIGSLATSGVKDQAERAELVAEEHGTWPPEDAEPVDIDSIYAGLAELGFEHGTAFQGVRQAWRRDGEVFAEVVLGDLEREQAGAFEIHPALLDAALHAIVLVRPLGDGEGADRGSGQLRLALSWSDVRLLEPGTSALRVRLTPTADGGVAIVLADESGRMVASVGGLTTHRVSLAELGESRGAQQGAMLGIDWLEGAHTGSDSPPSPATFATFSGRICEELHSVGVECELFADVDGLAERTDCNGVNDLSAPGVVLFDARVTSPSAGSVSGEGMPSQMSKVLHDVLGWLQAWLADERLLTCRLVVLTEGAVAVDAGEDVVDLAGGAVWGLVRSAQIENPGRLALVDVDGEGSSWSALAGALYLEEPQLALRNGTIRLPRLVNAYADELLAIPEDGSSWRLDIQQPGTLESLNVLSHEGSDALLGPGQVRVEVRAAGLNFRDALIAVGAYPGSASIGGEGSGVIVEVGGDVRDLAVGDRVMGFMETAMGDLSACDSRLLVPMPKDWSFVEGASMPIAFATAYYGLVDLAGLNSGERVLVHAAAGGVGIAAVQIARYLGAEVYGTASPGKWDALRDLGLADTHMASSRTLDFTDKLLDATEGRGVDVVLNSLAGEFIDGSLRVLANGGRFLELGKMDVRDREGISAEYDGVDYRAFDLMDAEASRLHEILKELVALFESNALALAPITTWSVNRARQAFRHMSQGKHVGKNVLRLPRPIDPEGTVLITGASGSLGSLVAHHLATEHGVRRLLLVSRRGPSAKGADSLIEELSSLGVHAEVLACDVSDSEQVKHLLAEISQEHALEAIFHAAGVIDDGIISSLTPERFDQVLAPKFAGAWNLHMLTRELDLSAFVMFSSIAATLGSAGQGNYAAANASLDALAAHRRSLGLSATSVAWGIWERESEMTSQLDELDRGRMSRSGMHALTDEQGLRLFDQALALDQAFAVATRLDMQKLRAQAGSGTLSSLYGELVRAPRRRSKSARQGSLARRISTVAGAERERVALDVTIAHVAAVLGHVSLDAIQPSQTFKDMGFDSLAAVEFRNRLAAEVGSSLPATLVFDYPTPREVAGHLLAMVGTQEGTQDSNSAISIDSEIAELEQRLSAIASNDAGRTRVLSSLQALLAGLTAGESALAEDDLLRSATAQEVFELIDRDLGLLESDGETRALG